MDQNESNSPLGRIAAALTILAMFIGAVFWIANVSATASHADQIANDASQKLEKKADKQDMQDQLKRIYDKLDSIDTYLRDRR